jgi:uncharacterized protein
MHYLLFYELADDYLARRPGFRDAHLEKAWAASGRGELVLGGALQDPVDGAVLLFQGDSPKVAEAFAKSDPYVTNGLVKRWHVREWLTVAGDHSATPVKPVSAGVDAAKESASSSAMLSAPPKDGLVLRMWKARTTPGKFGAYVDHVTSKVFPALKKIRGHQGAYLLRRNQGQAIEVVVLTLWDSMKAIRAFAGSDLERAVVEPEAKAALAEFDERVTHFEVVYPRDSGRGRGEPAKRKPPSKGRKAKRRK